MNIIQKVWSIPLIAKILIALVLGIAIGLVAPEWIVRIFETVNSIFSDFLGFIVPLIILGLVAPGIADLGQKAGKMLLLTVAIAYGFTLMSGFFTYLSCEWSFPLLLSASDHITLSDSGSKVLSPFFTVDIPPLMSIMTALVVAFTLGLGVAVIKGGLIKNLLEEFRNIIVKVIENIIIPILPLYILGIFMSMTYQGQVVGVLSVFVKVIAVVFILTVILLLVQFVIAGAVVRKNPLLLLRNMLPAYMTALGTQSSAATIPITLECALKNKVDKDIAGFVVPLCSTIHLSGSIMKITACAMAIMMISGQPVTIATFGPFIAMLGITMVAAPGVPGGAIMAALGLLDLMLGFGAEATALMIALYIAMDSFGTATNVTGDGAIAVIIDGVAKLKNKIIKN